MADSVLLRFLRGGLIDLSGDDAKFDKVKKTAEALAAILQKDPAKALAYALIASDPEAPSDDPVVIEVLEVLEQHWATYVNTFSDGAPVSLVRGLLLEALVTAAQSVDSVAIAFVTSARNVLRFMEVGGERVIWQDILQHTEAAVDQRAVAEWSTPDTIAVPKIEIKSPEIAPPKVEAGEIDREDLKSKIWMAAGPVIHQPQGQVSSGTNPNPHQSTNPPHWNYEFGIRLSAVLADCIGGAIAHSAITIEGSSEQLQSIVSSVSEFASATLKQVSAATSGLQRRTSLLWWKEALYSPGAKRSYREFPTEVAVVHMAFDMFQQVPVFSPASVSAFLFEAVTKLPGVDLASSISVRELVRHAQEHESLAACRLVSKDMVGAPDRRGCVLALIGHSDASNARDKAMFRRLTGIPLDAQLNLPEWSTWLFREFQAARAVSTATADGAAKARRLKKD